MENWEHKSKDFEDISRKIEESSGTVSEIIGIKREWAKGEGSEIQPVLTTMSRTGSVAY